MDNVSICDKMPSEKVFELGNASSLRESELFSLVFGSGSRYFGAVEVAESVTEYLKSCNKVPTLRGLMEIPGVGKMKAAQIMACLELNTRFLFSFKGDVISAPVHALPYLSHLKMSLQENFVCLTLDSAHQVIRYHHLTKGLVNQTPIHPREAFRKVIEDNATSVLFAHNHPSGNLKPSMSDVLITKKLVKSGLLLGIPVLDHLIIGKSGWCSLKKEQPHLFESKAD